MARKKCAARDAESLLRDFALSYPQTHEDFPWGERVIKVRKKVFLFLRCEDTVLTLGFKLPESSTAALKYPFSEPTRYGLGKSGWVTSTFSAGEDIPLKLLRSWIDESYRAVAPKKILRQLGLLVPVAAQPPAQARVAEIKRKASEFKLRATAHLPQRSRSKSHPRPRTHPDDVKEPS